MKKGLALLVIGLVISFAVFAGAKTETLQEDEALSGSITLYTSESLTDVQEYANQFMQQNRGTTVEIFRLGTTELLARLMTELDAGTTPADVVWFADMAVFEQLAADDLLLQISPPEAEKIPEKFVYFDGQAFEVRLIYQIVAYNTNLVEGEVRGWADLLDPKYRGRVGSASPFVSGATLTQIATVVQDPNLGWELYEKLAANDAIITGGNGGIAQGIALGEYMIGLTIDFMARAQKDQGAPVEYVYQEEGALYVPTPVGVMASTQNPALAEAFVNFLLSVPGQLQMKANGYMPVNSDVALPAGVPPASEIKVLQTDWTFLGENREDLLDRYGDIFGIE